MALTTFKASLEKYKAFVEINPLIAKDIETTLRWISYFMSGRFKNSQIVSELVYSCSNLLQMLNDYIVRKAAGIETTLNSNREAETLQYFITILEYIQVFSEFLAKSLSGEYGKWIVIAVIQTTKAVIKLLLLLKYDQGIQCQIPITPLERRRELQRNGGTLLRVGSNGVNKINEEQQSESSIVTLKRSGRVMRSLDKAPPRSKRTWMLPPVNQMQDMFEGERKNCFPTPLSDQQKIGEVLHILRPVAHVAAVGTLGESAWTPFMLSLGMDVASLQLLNSASKHLNANERIEIGQRSIALLFYLLRSPFFDKFTKVRILRILSVLAERIPIFGRLLRPFINYLPEWQKTYFYVWVM